MTLNKEERFHFLRGLDPYSLLRNPKRIKNTNPYITLKNEGCVHFLGFLVLKHITLSKEECVHFCRVLLSN